MAIAWFEVPYETEVYGIDHFPIARRTPRIFRYVPEIRKAGGECKCVEIEGDRCVAKVRATDVQIAYLSQEFKVFSKVEIESLKCQQLCRYKPRFDSLSATLKLDGEKVYLEPDAIDKLDQKVR